MSSYEEIYPIVEISEKRLLNYIDDISVSFSIEYPEVFLLKKAEYNALQTKLRSFIRLLPDYTIFHTVSFFDEERYEPEFHKAENFLMKHNMLYYLNRVVPIEKQYITITFTKKALPKSIQTNSLIKGINPLKKNPYQDYDSNLDAINISIKNIEQSLKSLFDNCNIKRLNDDEITQMLYEYSSLEYNSNLEKNYKLPEINFEKNKIGIYNLGVMSIYEGNKAQAFNKASLTNPNTVMSKIKQVKDAGDIDQSQIFPLTIGLPFKHAYSCIIQKTPKEGMAMEFELQERALKVPADFGFPAAKNKLKEITLYRKMIDDLDYTPVRMSMTVIIPERDKNLLKMKMESIKTSCSGIYEMKAIEQSEEAGMVFLSNIPGNASSCYKHERTTAFHAVSYLPKESHYRSDTNGFPFTDRFGKKVLVDIHNNPHMTNKNGVVIGPSGRGKSFTLNYLVSLIYQGAHLVIIDKGGSYENLCSLLGGQYYDSAKPELFKFSIFVCNKDKKGNYLPDEIQYNYVISILGYIWREGAKLKPESRTILREYVELYYEYVNKNKIQPSVTDFDIFLKENRDSFPKTHETYFEYDSFHLMLSPYTTGREKSLLNSDENIDLTYEKLSVFDMKSIEKADPVKFNLLCLMITFLNIKKIQHLPRSVFKSFIIDEALSFLKGDIGDFIGNLFAEVRKENGQVIVVAQGIKFILQASSEVREKIFSNRDFIVMTNHEGYENTFSQYTELLGFKEKDLELLSAVRKNEEVFIRLGDYPMLLRIEVSEEEYGVFTTEPDDMKRIKDFYRKYKSMQTAIEAFAEQKRKLKNIEI